MTSDIRRENPEPFNWISDENNSCGISLRNQTGNHAKLCNTSSQRMVAKRRWTAVHGTYVAVNLIKINVKNKQKTNTPPRFYSREASTWLELETSENYEYSLYYKFVIFRWLTSSNQLENNQEQVNCIIIIMIIINPQTNTHTHPTPQKRKEIKLRRPPRG